jgi:queuine tRNA-ribosyltransferase
VQGGVDVDLRAQCAADIATIGFDGHAIGGLSVGEPRSEMLPALDAAIAELPSQRPRYLMGVGDPISLVEGIARGVDMFDCVLPTRLARHGTALTHDGRVQLKNAAFRTATGPIDAGCGCVVCNRYSAGYVRHLLTVGEVSGGALLTIHNVAFLLDLVARARAAIASGTLAALVADVRRVWDDGRG